MNKFMHVYIMFAVDDMIRINQFFYYRCTHFVTVEGVQFISALNWRRKKLRRKTEEDVRLHYIAYLML